MPRTIFRQWRAENATTRYPFSDNATLTDGVVEILDGVFLDASVHPPGGREGMRLASVSVSHDTVTLRVGDDFTPALCAVTFDKLSPPSVARLEDAGGRPSGLFVFSPEAAGMFQGWEVGEYSFSRRQTEFVASVCFPAPASEVNGVLLDDGTLLTGDVWLVGDDGVVLRRSGGSVRVDVVGDPLFRRRLCSGAGLFRPPRFVHRLRVVHPAGVFELTPDARGDVQLTGGESLTGSPALRVGVAADALSVGLVSGD